jgi:hypothetical protein
LPRDFGGFGFVMLDDALDVVSLGRGMHGLNEVDFSHDRSSAR